MAMLEMACFEAAHAVMAADAGADRIELCRHRDGGGTTPIHDDVRWVKEHVSIPVFVMIRPRSGNFAYNAAEMDKMRSDILLLKPLADGFVFGVLNLDGTIDIARTSELVELAAPLPCTFHRAFDCAPTLLDALEDVIETGCTAILTSGGHHTAIEGVELLARVTQRAAGRITIIPGGGVRPENLAQLKTRTGATIFHTSALNDQLEGGPDVCWIFEMHNILGKANGVYP